MATDIVTRTGKAAALSAADNDQNLESLSGTVDAKVANYTVLYTDQNKTIEFNNPTAVTCNLSAVATILAAIDTTNFRVKIKNIGAGVCTIDPDGTEKVDSSDTYELSQWDSLEIQINSNNTGWNIISEGNRGEAAYATDPNGTPTVSQTSFTLSSIPINTYESIGPTGAGAQNTWTALDSVPAGVDWIEVRTDMTGTNTGANVAVSARARADDSTDLNNAPQTIASMYFENSGSTSITISNSYSGHKIPVNTARRFDGRWTATATLTAITLYLTGYGWNR